MNVRVEFPKRRPRRLRENPALRRLVRETAWDAGKLVAPLFISEGIRKREAIGSMPGVFRLTVAEAVTEAKGLDGLGAGGVLLFGIPKSKNAKGSSACASDGIVQETVRAIKRAVPAMAVITDVCLCEYTSHGHCGVMEGKVVDNDATLPLLAKTAVSHAKAGADLVAPSAMMDGQVKALRRALDDAGFPQLPVMSYSAKYASGLYGPFRDAAESTPQFGDRRGYQLDPPNVEEALHEVALDIEEGADIVMVKPALAYLDVLKAVKEKFHWPTAAYQVSGEYSLVKAAAARGWIDERRVVLELATAVRRAGADILITYHAKQIVKYLR